MIPVRLSRLLKRLITKPNLYSTLRVVDFFNYWWITKVSILKGEIHLATKLDSTWKIDYSSLESITSNVSKPNRHVL